MAPRLRHTVRNDRCLCVVAALSAWLGCAVAAAAQPTDATVSGSLHDAAGAPIPGSRIQLSGNTDVAADTDPAGRFRLLVGAGVYAVTLDGVAVPGLDALAVEPGGRLRLAIQRRGGDATDTRVAVVQLSHASRFGLDASALANLPLDRADAAAAVLDLAPGTARGTAFGTAADIGTPRRVDGLDLSDPFDGRPWASPALPAIALAAVRVGIAADEPDGSGAIVDLVTHAGGRAWHGTVDVLGGARAWTREQIDDETLAGNPRLAMRERPGRSFRAAAVLSGPLTSSVGLGLAVEHGDAARGDDAEAVERSPRAHGRLVWSGADRVANLVVFADRRSTSHDISPAVRGRVAPGVDNQRTSSTVAVRGSWQGGLRRTLRIGVSADVLRGVRSIEPQADVAAHEDEVTGLISGSLGLVGRGERTRLRAGGALDWTTTAAGGHDLRAGIDLDRATVVERTTFAGGEFFHDLAGRPDTVDVWDGVRRETELARDAVFVSDTWTPASRLAIVGGLRVARLAGGEAYRTSAIQPRVGATLALDDGGRIVVRGHVGVVADPLYATHVDRTLAGEAPLITHRILGGGRRVELERTMPVVASVGPDIRHPDVRELAAGGDVRLTSTITVGATLLARRYGRAIDTVYPESRWLPVTREGLDGEPVTVYRWLNRRAGEGPVLTNVDGVSYLAVDGQPIGVARAGRDYTALVTQVRADLPGDRGSIVAAFTTASNEGTIDDTHEAGISRSDRFSSPTAALLNAEGGTALTPALELTVFGTTRLPVVPIRVAAIYQRHTGARYAAQRTFTETTLNVPFDASGRTALLEARGARRLGPIDELSLRIAGPLPFSKNRVEIYADLYNVLGRATVTAVEPGAPLGVSSGVPLPFEAPLDVQPPFRVLLGGRFRF